MEFAVFTVPAAVLITLLVELLKAMLVDKRGKTMVCGRWSIIAAVFLGLLLSIANHLAEVIPGFEAWYRVVIAGLLAGFAACGLYDAARPTTRK